MKKPLIIISGAVAVVFVVFVFFPFLLIYPGALLGPNPPVPEVTYGEFPFSLEYSRGDHKFVVNDTLICEYSGVGANEGVGKYVKWNGRLKSGKERISLLKVNDSCEIYYFVGSPRYYMGYNPDYVTFNHIFPDASIEIINGSTRMNGIINAEELFDDYKIRLLNWEPSEPIINRPGPAN